MVLGGVPQGAVCATHLDTAANASCRRCGTFVCNACSIVDPDGTVVCAGCAPRVGVGIPWESRHELGLWPALVKTVKLALFRPQELFSGPPRDLGYGSPLLFAVILWTIGALFSALWQMGLLFALSGFSGALDLTTMTPQLVAQAGPIVFAPLVSVLGVFLWSGIVHVCLTLFGGARGSYDTTLRVVAYSSATWALAVVPVFGTWMAVVWVLVTQSLGLARAHGTTGGRATAAVLTPALVCCLGFSAIVATAFMTFLSAAV